MENISKEKLSQFLKINVISFKIIDERIYYSAECGGDIKMFSILKEDITIT